MEHENGDNDLIRGAPPEVEMTNPLDKERPAKLSVDRFRRSSGSPGRIRQSSALKPLVSWLNRFKQKVPRVIQLFILYFALGVLAAIGGSFFQVVEYDSEQDELDRKLEIWKRVKDNFNATELVDVRKWSDEYAQIFHDANKWAFHYSVFFAATTYTTCGFGLQAPATVVGRMFVILYGLPAIMVYGVIAKKIGILCMHFIQMLMMRCGVSKATYCRHRIKFIGFFFFFGFCSMGALIKITATDEGFGHGIYNFFDAIYFLYTTTLTIGYGDVMMSGANPILTVLIGLWLASTLGLAICFAQEIGEGLTGGHMDDVDAIHNMQDMNDDKLSVLQEEN